jgi:LmbE family N-acetylglucosaminyl deacetylase
MAGLTQTNPDHETARPDRPAGAPAPMDQPTPPARSAHWRPEFERLLQAVPECGSHGQLVDVREALRHVVGPSRPLVLLSPHADDGAITAACLLHEYAVRRSLPVIEVLVFAGERNVAAPWLNDKKKVSVRESEFRLECSVIGAEAVCWDLEAYRNPGYQPSAADIDKVVDWFVARKPGALILPPATDAHVAHRMTRALAAVGLLGAHLVDTLVLTGWTPWGPLPQPNAYFAYDGESERTKEWSIQCHASQVVLTDYTKYCSHLGRAYAALTREWAEGHSLAGRGARGDDRFIGVELFQIESFDPARGETAPSDPIRIALGLLNGSRADVPAAAVTV